MTGPHLAVWDDDGNAVTLQAAAFDALAWLDLFASHADKLDMPPVDRRNLLECAAALRGFLGSDGGMKERHG